MFYVYSLKTLDGYYVGCTKDLKDRLKRHSLGYVEATKTKLPVVLINYFAFANEKIAFRFEKYLKSGSGRAFYKNHFT